MNQKIKDILELQVNTIATLLHLLEDIQIYLYTELYQSIWKKIMMCLKTLKKNIKQLQQILL